MKKYFWLAALVFLGSCGEKKPFDFIIGKWEHRPIGSDVVVGEVWSYSENGKINGTGWIKQGADSVAFEELTIQLKEEKWLYSVHSLLSERPDVDFELITDAESDSLVFSCPANSFPAHIIYLPKSPSRIDVWLIPGSGSKEDTTLFEFSRASEVP